MSLLGMIASGGVWLALPWTGYWLVGRPARRIQTLPLPSLVTLALMTVAGLAVWSVALLGSAMAQAYHPEVLGVIGWVVTLTSVIARLPNAKAAFVHAWRGKGMRLGWESLLVVGLTLAAGFYWRYPSETLVNGCDEMVYASHGIFLAREGRLDVPYPWPDDLDPAFQKEFKSLHRLQGLYPTEPTLTVQFGHLFPVWLAQAFATCGPGGLFRLNAVFAILSLGVFYGLGRLLLPSLAAVAATLFLAFNPSQLWLARVSLSEMLTQLWIWSGLLALCLALKGGDRVLARWAGVFFGVAALVRCDSLLLVPLLFLSHLAMVLVHKPANGRPAGVWPALYQTALPACLLAVGYYRFFSTPYFFHVQEELAAIGLFTGLSLVVLLSIAPAAGFLRPYVRSVPTLSLVGVSLVALTAYAYWVRPRWYSQAFESWSLDHLARYLSPLVVWSAVAGWWLSLVSVRRQAGNSYWLPVLVIALGFAAVYLRNPSVDAVHFWAIRRFMPVVIPAFVLFAALGLAWALSRMPTQGSIPATALLLAWLSVFTVQRGRLIWFFRENFGIYASLRSMHEHLPPNALVVAHGSWWRLYPFPFAFGDRVVVLNTEPLPWEDPNEAEKAAALLNQWLVARLGQCEPAYLLCEGYRFPGRHNRLLHQETFWQSRTEQVWNPFPERIITDSWTLYLYQITEGPGPIDYIDIPLGNEPVWGVAESGLGAQDRAFRQAVRWIDGEARLVVPSDPHCYPRTLKVALWTGPKGAALRLRVNGQELFRGTIPPEDWSQTFDLSGVRPGQEVSIELVSDPLFPEERTEGGEGNQPERVMVKEVRLLREDPSGYTALNPHRR